MVKVLFFASLREKLGCGQLEVKSDSVANITELRKFLALKGDEWRQAMLVETYLVAVNQTIVDGEMAINAGDEVAFFPPVTGG